jgi:hypothetical protein
MGLQDRPAAVAAADGVEAIGDIAERSTQPIGSRRPVPLGPTPFKGRVRRMLGLPDPL